MFAVLLCLALHVVSMKVIGYFLRQNELGIILSIKLLQMAWLILFAMLVFSSMVTAVSTIFLSRDNEIIFSAPVTPAQVFSLRFTTTTAYTAWMMIVFSLPVFAAYGRVFHAGFFYFPLLLSALVFTALTASGFGMLVTVLLVNLFPARRTKDIVLYLSMCFGVFIYILFRLMRPEDLVNPESYSDFIEYLSSISRPAGPLVPAAWAANLLSLYLLDQEIDWLLLGVLVTAAPSIFFLGEWSMNRWFFRGYSKAQESFGGYRRFASKARYRPYPGWWIFAKEAKTFLRDSSEWAQIFMIAALIVVYLYNFKVLPVNRSAFEEEYITNIISFLNIGLTSFVVTSLSARFVFPSVGAEGGAFSLIQSSPLSIGRFLLYKYLYYVIPMTGLALVLVIASDHLLNISGPMWWISVVTSVLLTWTVVAMALGFGAQYADFRAENRAAALGGMGAILFLLLASAFEFTIILLGAYPAYRLVMFWLRGALLEGKDLIILGTWIAGSVLLAIAVTMHCISKGVRRLANSSG